MSHQDMEAFEKWAHGEGSYDLATDHDGDYAQPDTLELHRGWQAARAHYLTEMEQSVCKALERRFGPSFRSFAVCDEVLAAPTPPASG